MLSRDNIAAFQFQNVSVEHCGDPKKNGHLINEEYSTLYSQSIISM